VKIVARGAESPEDLMINYTERLWLLMSDIVQRVPMLSALDMSRVLVFARSGRAHSDGPYATCHCVSLPPSEPGYYYWRDRATGVLTRRSEWFITKSPIVKVGGVRIDFMVSFVIPRFCDQRRVSARKRACYAKQPSWIAKLDTIVHELYHIDPDKPGIRRIERADGSFSANCHGPAFFEDVVAMVTQYLDTRPHPETYDFLQYDFSGLTARYGGVVGTAFRTYPSYPQRYIEVLSPQPEAPTHDCRVDPIKRPRAVTRFSEDDLVMREFLPETSRLLIRKGKFRAA
jgi:hypothetical protein